MKTNQKYLPISKNISEELNYDFLREEGISLFKSIQDLSGLIIIIMTLVLPY